MPWALTPHAFLLEQQARIDFDEDMPSMDSDRLKKQVCTRFLTPVFL
jgi:hypothetical protein